MDRYEYLGTLKYYLRGLSNQESEQIIDEFKSHFVEAELSGRTDEETANALGDPKVIAGEILEELEDSVEEKRETKSNNFGGFLSKTLSDLIDKVTESSIVIDLSKKDKKEKETSGTKVSGETIVEEEFHSVFISAKMTDVVVKASDDNETRIWTDEGGLTYRVNDGVLKIVNDGNQLQKTYVGALKNLASTEIMVYLPSKKFTSFEVKSQLGSFEADKISAEEVILINSIGDLNVREVNADKINVSVKTGDTELSNVETPDLDASVSTGDLDVIGINPDANMKLSVSVGDATIKYRTVPTDVTVNLVNKMGSVKTNGLFKENDRLGDGTATVTGAVSMGDLKFKLV